MPSNPILNYTKGVAICHGKSEVHMVKYVTTNLHLNLKHFARQKGASSIQITSLMDVLNASPFNNINNLSKAYEIQVTGKGANRKIQNFKIFAIMDTDDCSPQQKQDFISKKMFLGHWLYDYIVPIFNSPKLEKVMEESKISTKKIKDSEKGEYYEKIFPINTEPFSSDTLLQVTSFMEKVKKSRNTNLPEFISYCLSLLPQ